MKKKVLSFSLRRYGNVLAVGCGSNKSASTDAKDDTKTESSADGENNQILFNGSSTLAPVITSIATNFFDTYGTWKAYDSSLPEKILQFMFPQVVPDKEQKLSSMVHLLSVW